MNKPLISVIAMALIGATAMTASAATIFGDDFNRGASYTVGNGWSEFESDSADVSLIDRAIGDQQLQIRDDDPLAIASQLSGLSTLGYASVTLAYEWAPTNNTERGDFLRLEWRDGSAPAGLWTEVASHALMGPASYSWASWDIAAGGLTDFEFRFRVDVDANNEGAYVDNVSVTGNGGRLGAVNAVPEPGSLVLAGLALGMLGWSRRKVELAAA